MARAPARRSDGRPVCGMRIRAGAALDPAWSGSAGRLGLRRVRFSIVCMPSFDIDPDIRRAYTPPASFYTDPKTFEALKRRAFGRSWQLVADADVVKAPGNVYPCPFLEGAIEEPLLITRDYDDQVHCLANVCTHRGNLVCEGAGTEKNLRCRYHGRRFDLEGKFLAMPAFENG